MRRPSQIVLQHPGTGPRLRDRSFVVTGGDSEIGVALARILNRSGADVLLLIREEARAPEIRASIAGGPRSTPVEVLAADLQSRQGVEEVSAAVAARRPRIHGLVHCAALTLPTRRQGPDGTEAMFAVEILAPFLLTNRLIDALERGAPSRVVLMSGEGHRKGFRAPRALDLDNLQGERRFHPFAHANHLALARILLTQELARKLEGTGISAFAVAPGPVRSGTLVGFPWHLRLAGEAMLRFQGPQPATEAAMHLVHAVADPELEGTSGRYVLEGREIVPSPAARDAAAARRLWEVAEEILGERFLPG